MMSTIGCCLTNLCFMKKKQNQVYAIKSLLRLALIMLMLRMQKEIVENAVENMVPRVEGLLHCFPMRMTGAQLLPDPNTIPMHHIHGK